MRHMQWVIWTLDVESCLIWRFLLRQQEVATTSSPNHLHSLHICSISPSPKMATYVQTLLSSCGTSRSRDPKSFWKFLSLSKALVACLSWIPSVQFEPVPATDGYGVCTANKSKVNWLLNLHPGPSRKCDSTCYRDTRLQSFEMQSSHCGHQGSGNVFLKPANLGHGLTDGQSWW